MASYAQVAARNTTSNGRTSNERDTDSSSEEGEVKRTHHDEQLPSTHFGSKLTIAAKGEEGNVLRLINPVHWIEVFLAAIYVLIQSVIASIFSPRKPAKGARLSRPRGHVAIVGAGVTGTSTAAHLIGHGFEATIFDEYDDVGGVWQRVNTTSGLQLNSLLYRFFPSVRYSHSYPKRAEILSEIHKVAEDYGLYERTRLSTKVTKVERSKGKKSGWIVNGDTNEVFDGIVVAVGTCGKPKMIDLPHQDRFKGKIIHSSQLDGVDLTDKRVAIVGAGASGVEAAELALSKNCESITVLARSPHWIISRGIIVGTLLAMQPFGRETPLSFIPENLLRLFHYRSAAGIAPKNKGLFTATPVVNNAFLTAVRKGQIEYLIGDVKEVEAKGVKFSRRENGSKPESPGTETVVSADVIVLATGFERPSVDFLPEDLFPKREDAKADEADFEQYSRPNLYLQNFSTVDSTVLLTNSAYLDAIGTAGHVHIGIYARILALFLVDPKTRPSPSDAKLWVSMIAFIKRNAFAGAFDFFTYSEMTLWLFSFHFLNWRRTKWALFTLLGFGLPPLK